MITASHSKAECIGYKNNNDNPTFKAYKTIETGNTTEQSLTKLLLCKIKQVFSNQKQQNNISKYNKFNKKRRVLKL